MDYKDYYKILGVAPAASLEEIKRAYRRLARKFHPDVSKEANAEERFKQVNEAYEVLSDRSKRTAYDSLGRFGQAGGRQGPAQAGDRPFGFGGFGRARPRSTRDFTDFFESLFGGAGLRGAGREAHFDSPRGEDRPGEDVETTLTLTLEEAYTGATKSLSVGPTAPGHRSAGLGSGARALRVRVPPGALDGQRLRVPAQGAAGAGRGRRGDVFAMLRLAPHAYFRPQGRDIHLDLPVLPWEAALGATVQTPTLGGPVDLRVPRGSQSGQKLRLKGRGLPGAPAGDQLVQLLVIAPPASTAEAEALYLRMSREMPADPRAHFGLGRSATLHES